MAPRGECRPGVPCIFLGREPGWEPYNESPSHSQTYPPRLAANVNTSTLYLTMSSFRDRLCPSTLYFLFTKAAHPSRVHVGVVQQNTPEDLDCLLHYCEMMRNSTQFGTQGCPFEKNIRIMRVDAAEAKGPTWARSLGSTMMQDEEFCMQTDSHMNFVPDWDVHMIAMWSLTKNEYAVLSTYVADSGTLAENMPGTKGTNGVFEVPHLCMVTFSGGYGMVRNWGTKCLRSMSKPKMTNMVWGAGLSFSKCHAERKAPYDPHTPHIFDGEEFERALRFWTWGYDIYTPHRVYVVHNYRDSQSDPKHMAWAFSKVSQEQRNREVEAATLRLRMLMEMPSEARMRSINNNNAAALRGAAAAGAAGNAVVAGVVSTDSEYVPAEVLALQQSRFGLGDRRTLDQAIAFSGIDTKRRTMVGNRCGNLDYVPFTEHPWGAEYVPKYDAVSESFLDVRDPGSIYYDVNNAEMKGAWERADQLHREGLIQAKQPAVSAVQQDLVNNIALSTMSVKNAILPAHFSIPVRESPPPPENKSAVHQSLMDNKLAINLFCLFLIVCIIVGRICVQQRFKLRKSLKTYLSLEDDDSSSIKHV